MKYAVYILILFLLALVVLLALNFQGRAVINKELSTSAGKEIVWNYLSAALLDSGRIGNWPNERLTYKCLELREGADLHAAYSGPWFTANRVYEVTELDEGEKVSFKSYPQHLLGGRTTIKLNEKNGLTKVLWQADYSWTRPSSLALSLEYSFFDEFFSRLSRALRDLE